MLSDEYYGKRETISNDWQMKVDHAKINGGVLPDHPGFPPFPNETEIITKAHALNGFVSNIPTNTLEKTSKKST